MTDQAHKTIDLADIQLDALHLVSLLRALDIINDATPSLLPAEATPEELSAINAIAPMIRVLIDAAETLANNIEGVERRGTLSNG